jgi:hypothetical protein
MKRLLGYLIGIALTLLGILAFTFEITDHNSRTAFVGYVIASVFLLTGITMIAAVCLQYGGGFWTSSGYLLTALGVLDVIDSLNDFLRKNEKPDSSDFLICFVLLALGIAFLGQGHRTHLWKKRNQYDGPLNLNSSAEPPPRSLMRSVPWAPAWIGVVFGVWFVWHHIDTTMKLGSFVQAWKTEGFPTHMDGLDRWYTPVPSNQNAALVYEEAFTNLVKSDASIIEHLGVHSSEIDAAAIATERAQTKAILSRNRKALELLHAATNYSQSRYSSVLRPDSAPDFSHLKTLWISAELLSLEHREYGLDGHENEAVDSTIALFALGDSLANEPFLKSQWSRLACHEIAAIELEWILNFVAFRESDLLRLDAAVRRAQQTSDHTGPFLGDFLAAMQAQPFRCIDATYRHHPLQAGLYKTFVVLTDRERVDKLFYAASVKASLKALNNPYPLRLQMLPDSRNAQAYAKQHGYFVSAYFMEKRANFCIALTEDCARLRVLQTVIAIERYRIANNRELPQNLKDLTPRFLPSVPEDPFDGYPLKYQRHVSDYAVYSIGADMRDDGGQPRKKGIASYDIVIRLSCNDSKSGITSK